MPCPGWYWCLPWCRHCCRCGQRILRGHRGRLLWMGRRFRHDIASPWTRSPLVPRYWINPGSTLYLYVSAELPSGTALNVFWDGRLLGQLQGRPQVSGGAWPWYRLSVPWSTIRSQTVAEVIVAPAQSTEGSGSPSLGAVPYFRPPGAGAHASALLDAQGQYVVDLDPDSPGNQPGRWLIELRVHDQDNQVVAVWY